jgi:hypothetical protein
VDGNIVTPVWTGSALIVSGIRQGTHAYRLALAGGKWAATEIWKNADVTMYMSTPVVADGVVYGLSAKRKGQFVALDAATGALKWATEGREGEHASLWLTPQHVAFLSNTGALVVARPLRRFVSTREEIRALGQRNLGPARGCRWRFDRSRRHERESADREVSQRPPSSRRVPSTARVPVVDELHGQRVTDDYRWLEGDDAAVAAWTDAQNAHTRDVLDASPRRRSVKTSLGHSWRSAPSRRRSCAGRATSSHDARVIRISR